MIILSRSGRRVEVALAHNHEKGCVTRADNPSPSLGQASSGVGYYSITRPVGVGVDALKAIGPLGFPFIYRPARSPQTRSICGHCVDTPSTGWLRLAAVAHACEARTGTVSCQYSFGRLYVALGPGTGETSCRVQLRCRTRPYHTPCCDRLDTRRSGWQSDKGTAKVYVGEELSV